MTRCLRPLGLLFASLLCFAACATLPSVPTPLAGEELVYCSGQACPDAGLLEQVQERIGRVETFLGRSSGPRLVFQALGKKNPPKGSHAVLLSPAKSGGWEVRAATPTLSSLLAGVI